MRTIQEVAKKFDITPGQASQLYNAMSITWGTIYSDIMNCFEGGEDEAYSAYSDEAEMVAENTLDADRVTTFCPDQDLKWVYRLEDSSYRMDIMEMGEAIWRTHGR